MLKHLESAGIRLMKEKCAFLLPMVEYLGHKISEKKDFTLLKRRWGPLLKAPPPPPPSEYFAAKGIFGFAELLWNISAQPGCTQLALLYKPSTQACFLEMGTTVARILP